MGEREKERPRDHAFNRDTRLHVNGSSLAPSTRIYPFEGSQLVGHHYPRILPSHSAYSSPSVEKKRGDCNKSPVRVVGHIRNTHHFPHLLGSTRKVYDPRA